MDQTEQHAILAISLMAAFADGGKDEREREQIKRIAAAYNVDIKAAALQFSLANPAVAAVIPGASKPGRQSHTWMRTPEGWRIVAAHVSLLGEATPMKTP